MANTKKHEIWWNWISGIEVWSKCRIEGVTILCILQVRGKILLKGSHPSRTQGLYSVTANSNSNSKIIFRMFQDLYGRKLSGKCKLFLQKNKFSETLVRVHIDCVASLKARWLTNYVAISQTKFLTLECSIIGPYWRKCNFFTKINFTKNENSLLALIGDSQCNCACLLILTKSGLLLF